MPVNRNPSGIVSELIVISLSFHMIVLWVLPLRGNWWWSGSKMFTTSGCVFHSSWVSPSPRPLPGWCRLPPLSLKSPTPPGWMHSPAVGPRYTRLWLGFVVCLNVSGEWSGHSWAEGVRKFMQCSLNSYIYCTKPLSTIQCNKTLGQDKLVYTTHRLNALAAPPGIRV